MFETEIEVLEQKIATLLSREYYKQAAAQGWLPRLAGVVVLKHRLWLLKLQEALCSTKND